MTEAVPSEPGIIESGQANRNISYHDLSGITDRIKTRHVNDGVFLDRVARFTTLQRTLKNEIETGGITPHIANHRNAILLAGMDVNTRKVFENNATVGERNIYHRALELADSLEHDHQTDIPFLQRVNQYSAIQQVIHEEWMAGRVTQDEADNQLALLLAGMDAQTREDFEARSDAEVINTTDDLIADEGPNPYEPALRTADIPIDIPARFLDPDMLPLRTDIDPRTGLPLEQRGMRKQLLEEFSTCIRQRKKWMIIYADADNLKQANTKHSHEFGNMVIKYGAAQTTQAIDQLQLPEGLSMYAVRQTSAADEVVMYIFDPTDEQIERIQGQIPQVETRMRIDEPPFTFSLSTAAMTSEDESIRDEIRQTKEFLDEDTEAVAYDTFKNIKNKLDEQVKVKKIAKDIERIDPATIAGEHGYNQIRTLIENELGDSRVGIVLLSRCFDILDFERDLSYREALGNDETFRDLLVRQGRPEEEIQIRLAENARVKYYNSLISTNTNA